MRNLEIEIGDLVKKCHRNTIEGLSLRESLLLSTRSMFPVVCWDPCDILQRCCVVQRFHSCLSFSILFKKKSWIKKKRRLRDWTLLFSLKQCQSLQIRSKKVQSVPSLAHSKSVPVVLQEQETISSVRRWPSTAFCQGMHILSASKREEFGLGGFILMTLMRSDIDTPYHSCKKWKFFLSLALWGHHHVNHFVVLLRTPIQKKGMKGVEPFSAANYSTFCR